VDFDRVESHIGVVAALVPATPSVEAQSKNNRGGRDKPGHDPIERGQVLQPDWNPPQIDLAFDESF